MKANTLVYFDSVPQKPTLGPQTPTGGPNADSSTAESSALFHFILIENHRRARLNLCTRAFLEDKHQEELTCLDLRAADRKSNTEMAFLVIRELDVVDLCLTPSHAGCHWLVKDLSAPVCFCVCVAVGLDLV